MTPFRDLPIRHKLLLMMAASIGSALIIAGGGFLIWEAIRFRSEVDQEVAAQMRIVAENTAAPLAFDDDQAAGETLAVLELRPRITMACLYEERGRLLATYHRDSGTACPSSPPSAASSWYDIHAVETVVAGGAPVGTLYVHRELSDLLERLRIGLVAMIALLLLASAAGVAIALRIQRSISTPLLALAATASAISDSPGYPRLPVSDSRDEIGTVIRAFNRMVGSIEQHTTALSRTNAELQNANRLKDEFLATLSHELRTPLNAVLGWARLLRTTPVEPPLLTRALDSIERNAQAQTRLIEDLLEVSRIVTGKLRLQVAVVDLAAVVDSAVEIVQPAAAAKRITLRATTEARPALTSGDADRLQQVIWNLLSNAVKFTPPGGEVNVRLWRDHEYHLTVRDSGAGIDSKFLPHLFEAFRQADGTPSREHGGLGLGLAIAKQLVELHGGRIAAHSDGPGTGALLAVTLPSIVDVAARPAPAREAAADHRPPASSLPPLLQDLRVLVVDDQEDARSLLETALTRYGARVTTASSAGEAIASIDRARPHVLLSDIGMPNEDGYSLIRRLRSRPPAAGGAIPAVALTAYASERDRLAALEAGYQAHVTKPFELETLAALVARLGREGLGAQL